MANRYGVVLVTILLAACGVDLEKHCETVCEAAIGCLGGSSWYTIQCLEECVEKSEGCGNELDRVANCLGSLENCTDSTCDIEAEQLLDCWPEVAS